MTERNRYYFLNYRLERDKYSHIHRQTLTEVVALVHQRMRLLVKFRSGCTIKVDHAIDLSHWMVFRVSNEFDYRIYLCEWEWTKEMTFSRFYFKSKESTRWWIKFTYKMRKSLQCDRSGIVLSLFDFNSLVHKTENEKEMNHHTTTA